MASTADIHALRALGQHLDALAIAVLAGDPVRAMIATNRLRRAAYRACRAADAAGVARLVPYIHEKVQPMLSLAWLVPGLTPAMYASGLDADHDDAPHLVGLQAHKADLHETSWRSLHATDCVLDGARLRAAILDNAVLESCNLDEADLTGASLRWAKLEACTLAGARLANAALEHVRFVDCDLRGADLSALSGAQASPTSRAAFVRCDLRDSVWNARELAGVVLVDCKLEGARAQDIAGCINADGAHPAAASDGSEHDHGDTASPRQVRRRWLS